MSTRNIGVLAPCLNWQGGSQVAVSLAESMAQHGHRVELFIIAPAWGPAGARPRPNVETTHLAATNHISAVKRTRGRMVERQLDVVLAVGDYASMVLGYACMGLSNRPRALVGSEQFAESVKFGDFRHLRGRVSGVLMRHIYRDLDAVVCVNADLQARVIELLDLDAVTCPVIHNPVRLSAVDAEMVDRRRQERRRRGDEHTVAAAGALIPSKDWPTLLRAIEIAGRRLPIRLKVAGDGPERSHLEDLSASLGIGSRVEFRGVVSDMSAFLANCDLLVHSATQEAFGLVLVEALSQGLPIVSTDGPGPSEILTDGVHGRLVPVGDPPAMAEAMISTLSDPPETSELIERASAFDADRISLRYLELFEDILSRQ